MSVLANSGSGAQWVGKKDCTTLQHREFKTKWFLRLNTHSRIINTEKETVSFQEYRASTPIRPSSIHKYETQRGKNHMYTCILSESRSSQKLKRNIHSDKTQLGEFPAFSVFNVFVSAWWLSQCSGYNLETQSYWLEEQKNKVQSTRATRK